MAAYGREVAHHWWVCQSLGLFTVLYPSSIDARVVRTWWRWVPRTHTTPSVIVMTMSSCELEVPSLT